MKKGILAIYDLETEYSYRLMDYMNRKEDFMFEGIVFTNQESILQYLEKDRMDILLTGETVPALSAEDNIKLTIHLSEERERRGTKEYPCIYKFQAADAILQGILSCYVNRDAPDTPIHYLSQDTEGEVIGIVSPCGGTGKSTFAVGLGQILARDRRVLLLNLEAIPGTYAGESEENHESMGLSDLIYYIRQKKQNVSLKIKSMVRKSGGLEYLLPADHYTDLYEITDEDVHSLMTELKLHCGYEIIILDLGYFSESTFTFLKCCNQIYMPSMDNRIAGKKEEAWIRMLEMQEGQQSLNQVRKIRIPYDELAARGDYNNICSGDLGKFIELLLSSEKGGDHDGRTQ